MAMQRWDPWTDLQDVERRMADMMRFPLTSWWRTPSTQLAWAPPVEVYEKDDKVMVKAEVPGMTKDDIDVSVQGDMLTISGEKKTESEVKEQDYYRSEFSYGRFSRSVALPTAVDASKVEANYNNGVLEISLPKSEEAKPRKIEIKSK